MKIDSRLNEIDDCLYRVSTKTMIVHDDKVLLVKEIPEQYWAFPGGGVDHGENVKTTLVRELVEELGVTPEDIHTDFKLVHHTLGTIVNGIPRMNLYYKVSLHPSAVKSTDSVVGSRWFSRDEFMSANMSPSYSDRDTLAKVIFST